MQIVENLSCREQADLEPLVVFVKGRCLYGDRAVLELHSAEDGMITSGTAERFWPDNVNSVSRIRLNLSSGLKYPVVTFYRKSVGDVVLLDWREEFVYVLAHEARHIDQFHYIFKKTRYPEVDAESFAVETLEAFRLKRFFPISTGLTSRQAQGRV